MSISNYNAPLSSETGHNGQCIFDSAAKAVMACCLFLGDKIPRAEASALSNI
jgi:hypothetical protein